MEETKQVIDADGYIRLASCGERGVLGTLKPRNGATQELIESVRLRAPAEIAKFEVLSEEDLEQAKKSAFCQKISNSDDIDLTEAALIGLICDVYEQDYLLSGDKRFFTRFESVEPVVFDKLRPRLLSFEGLLMKIISHFGFAETKDKLIAGASCDKTLSLALGTEYGASDKNFVAAIKSYDPLS